MEGNPGPCWMGQPVCSLVMPVNRRPAELVLRLPCGAACCRHAGGQRPQALHSQHSPHASRLGRQHPNAGVLNHHTPRRVDIVLLQHAPAHPLAILRGDKPMPETSSGKAWPQRGRQGRTGRGRGTQRGVAGVALGQRTPWPPASRCRVQASSWERHRLQAKQ